MLWCRRRGSEPNALAQILFLSPDGGYAWGQSWSLWVIVFSSRRQGQITMSVLVTVNTE